MPTVIESQGLTKNFRVYEKEPGLLAAFRSLVYRPYRNVQAVSDFSLTIEQGEFVGLLGPNGAGKTSLMKLMTGIIMPTAGEVRVLGFTPFDREIPFRKRIALVMGQKSQLWWDIPALDSFELIRCYYEIPSPDFQRRLALLANTLEVTPLLRVHIRKLSLGERMKMELIACLLHEPRMLFLDEPTIGLDVVAQQNIRAFLRRYQEQHETTIVLTSHYMADVAELCSRIVLILGGAKRFDGALEQFERLLGREKLVRFHFSEAVQTAHGPLDGLHIEWSENRTVADVQLPESDIRERVGAILATFPVDDFSTEKLPIERVLESLLRRPELLDARGEARAG